MKLITLPVLLASTWLLHFESDFSTNHRKHPELGPMITFDTTLFDFGTIPYASSGSCTFTFTNTGDAPLIIETFRTSCGCLVPYWEKEPVLPGHTGKVGLKYDTRRPGPFQKTATLQSNATNAPVVLLRIKGTVLADTHGNDH